MEMDKQKVIQLTDGQLVGLLVTDRPHGYIYRSEVYRRAENGHEKFKASIEAGELIMRNGLSGPLIIQSNFQLLVDNAINQPKEKLTNLVKYILSSKWDFKDPRGRMTKDPVQVKDFLEDLASLERRYDEQDDPTKRLINTVIASFRVWLMTHKD